MEIKRGDVYYVKQGNYVATGSEQNSNRPAVIIQNDIGNAYSPTVIVGYLTTRVKKNYPMHAQVMGNEESIFMGEQLYTVSKDRIGAYIRSCTDEEMKAIDEAIAVSLGLQRCEECQTAYEYEEAEKEWIKRSEELANHIEELVMQKAVLIKELHELETQNEALQEAESKNEFYKKFYDGVFRAGNRIEIKVG